MPQRIQSLDPILGVAPHTLILGSIPGRVSLEKVRYYGHPRNAFWPIAAHWLGFDPESDYENRLECLTTRGFALWDVVARCTREASSDASIREAEPNAIPDLIDRHPTIARILLNGGTAARAFEKLVRRPNADLFADREIHALPSTSPANAGWSFAKKLDAWRLLRPS
ncbi:MAG: DNA-deoxyinosine glycosylase [Planctomycetota bacterium]